MKTFEISSKTSKNGRRAFKMVLHQIYPDSCIDELTGYGTQFNRNGITWIEEYCSAQLDTIPGMSLKCEFLDENRTELGGHGFTEVIDSEPIYEDATVIGTFTKGYIDDIETDEGTIRCCIGEGYIDSSCYHNLCKKIDECIAEGTQLKSSVEIMRKEGYDQIEYKTGFVQEGRIPEIFSYSGDCLLGVLEADPAAMLLELNSKEEYEMNKEEISAIIAEVVSELNNAENKIAEANAVCDSKVAEANASMNSAIAEKNELVASSEELKAALAKIQEEYAALNAKYGELWEERNTLEKALAEAQARERLAALDKAIEGFSAEEQKYAEAEIAACKEDPMNHEINSIVSKIYENIGIKAKKEAEEAVVAEQNSAKEPETEIDIFGAIEIKTATEDVNIFD